jgi:hypothetical protein
VGELAVGFGAAPITPDLPVVLAGFGARKGAVHEVRDDLEAHAVVVRGDGRILCLLVLDLLLIGADHADPVRAAVAAALGTSTDDVLTSCTHTHSGPAADAALRRIGWPVPEGFRDRLVEGCVRAALAAAATAEPARLAFARGPLPADLSMNRRGLPYEPSYAVLDVLRADGSRIGSLAGVGIHPVALGITCRAVSGDWVTSYRRAAAASTGAPAVLLQGSLGDVNPTRDPHTDPDPGGNWETARVLGTEVADAVSALLASAVDVPSTLDLVSHRVVPLRAGLTVPALISGVAGRRVPVELTEWSLGGVRLVSVPGEAFHAMGRAVEQARGDRALIAGLAPTYAGYLPAPFGKGYEEKMSYGRRFVARLTDLLLEVPG